MIFRNTKTTEIEILTQIHLSAFKDFFLATLGRSTVSMPIKAFDYLAAGLPMLNSLGMDLGDMIEKHKLGVNYKAGNYFDLFNKVEYLSSNKDLLNEMKENCLEISKQFDEKILYKEYVAFCETVLNEVIK